MKKFFMGCILKLIWIIDFLIPKCNNKVIFFSMPDYSDNSRSLFNYLESNGYAEKYNIVFVVKNVPLCKQKYGDKPVTFLRHRSLPSLWAMCRSKYIFRTHSFWGNVYVKNRQKMCVVWHGMPIKQLSRRTGKAKHETKCDFLVSTSTFFHDEMSFSMGINRDNIIVTGLPRNDDLFCTTNVKKEIGIDNYDKVILWMPTFRNNLSGNYCDGIESDNGIPLCSNEDLEVVNDILLRKNNLLILKLHPWATDKLGEITFSNIRVLKDADIPKNRTLYNVVGCADALITDYSSIYIDYLLLNRPICFVVDDIEEYRNTRGFIIEPVEEYMPGQKIRKKEEMFHWLEEYIVEDGFETDRKKILNMFHDNVDNNSCERVLAKMSLL